MVKIEQASQTEIRTGDVLLLILFWHIGRKDAVMADYIWLDEDGEEVDRKPKGRGRSRKGFTQADDGNWYNRPLAAPEEPPEDPEEPPEDPEDVEPVVTHRRRVKIVKATKRVTVGQVTKTLFALDLLQEDGLVTVIGPVVEGDCGVEQILPNAIYSKIELDTVADEIRVYSPNCPVSPSLIIKDIFKESVNEA